MTDIVSKINTWAGVLSFERPAIASDLYKATDEIERLRAALATARREALEEAAVFVENGRSSAFSENLNEILRVNAFAIRALKVRTP
jgi:hypothetical protein